MWQPQKENHQHVNIVSVILYCPVSVCPHPNTHAWFIFFLSSLHIVLWYEIEDSYLYFVREFSYFVVDIKVIVQERGNFTAITSF